jgi:hypothetical protein
MIEKRHCSGAFVVGPRLLESREKFPARGIFTGAKEFPAADSHCRLRKHVDRSAEQ